MRTISHASNLLKILTDLITMNKMKDGLMKRGRENSRKSVCRSLVLVDLMLMYWNVWWQEGQRPRRGQRSMLGRFWGSRLGFEPWCWDLSLEARIWALRLVFEPQSWDLSLKGGIWALRLEFEPWGWDLSLEAGIWAWRQGFESQG